MHIVNKQLIKYFIPVVDMLGYTVGEPVLIIVVGNMLVGEPVLIIVVGNMLEYTVGELVLRVDEEVASILVVTKTEEADVTGKEFVPPISEELTVKVIKTFLNQNVCWSRTSAIESICC